MSLGDLLFPHAELKLVIARSFEADIEAVKGRSTKEYETKAARILLSNTDSKRLNLKDGHNASVESSSSKVIVRAFADEKVKEGFAVMPYGPWALALVSVSKNEGPMQLQGLLVKVSTSKQEVTSLDSLFETS